MGKIGKGITRALAINPGGTVNRALGGNAGVAAVIGIAVAIAIPFAAPVVAGAIFGSTSLAAMTAAGAMIGAAGGALSGSMTGNMGRGALIGGAAGAAGGFIQGGGIEAIGGLFGGGATVVPETGQAISGAGYEQLAGGGYEQLASGSVVPIGSAAPAAIPAASYDPNAFGMAVQASPQVAGIGSAVAGPATIPAGSTLPAGANAPAASGSWGSRFLGGLTGAGTKMDLTTAEGFGRALSPVASPAGIAGVGQLAMTMFNKPPEGLTAQERSYLDETAALAGTNRDMFEQRVQAARRLLQSGQANPEQAYAQANIGVQRRFREAGLREEGDVRRGQIEGARLGTLAAANEQGRASQATVAGLAAMPGAAPMGPVALGLPVYRESERRRREYDRDISSGFGTLASAFSGRGRAGLFA
jgi:hypothetical protein